MKKGFFMKSRKAVCLLVIASFGTWLPGGAVWAANLQPLSAVAIPTPPNLGDFVKDKAAAIKLGKALFWDMNVGGDGVQACATCHYRAGADPINDGHGKQLRDKNQVNPRVSGTFTTNSVVTGPNQTLTAGLFPFTQVANPLNAKLDPKVPFVFTRDFNDVVGSQGVSFTLFTDIVLGNPVDAGIAQVDPAFGTSRRVTGRNTPSAVNAVFNYANFWDGRANNIFNGASPLGPLDASAQIWVNLAEPGDTPVLVQQKVAIPNASLASQAVGPPNNDVEMSYSGRTFPQLGHKMLNNDLTPLGQQLVSKTDSALGALSNQNATLGAKGLNTTYAALVKAAFWDKYWSAPLPNISGSTQMEANFSLFWGLSIMLYEATLVSDQTPFDLGTMTPTQQAGSSIFSGKGGCNKCHSGSEFTDASVSEALAKGLIDIGQTNAGGAISDNGFHNLGARPTADDIGRGGIGGSPNTIASFAGEAIAQANGALPFAAPQAIIGGITPATPVAVNGSFKTPGLRNVGLNAPYFHNGSMETLEQVVELYSRHGNFANPELAKDMSAPFGGGALSITDQADLVEFLQNGLTDPRVDAESAPFDHPELIIPNINLTDNKLVATGNNDIDPIAILLSKTPETATLADLPKATVSGAPTGTTKETTATLTVGGVNVATYQFKVDGGAASANIPVASTLTLQGLSDGPHTITVTGIDAAGHPQLAANQTSASWTVKTTLPDVNIGAVETMTKKSTQTVSGTVETGGKVAVSVDTGAVVGPVTVSGTTWSCQVSGLNKGTNIITVTATDAVGNAKTKTATVKILISDGCFRGTGNADISDALKSLKMAVGLITPTEDDLLHGDVSTNGKIDSGDALLILKKVAGLASF